MNIFGYYTDVPALVRLDELKLVCLWRERWAGGWTPVVLNEYIARKHPYFEEYDKAISAIPSVNPDGYERACWLRHLALAQVGGGYMADFDCIPYPSTDEVRLAEMDSPRLQMFQKCAPSLFYASKQAAENICREFAKGTWGPQEINGKIHLSDMYSLAAMPPEMVERHDLVKGYGDEGWETAPFVHFSSGSMKPNGKDPKWRHIPKLRK